MKAVPLMPTVSKMRRYRAAVFAVIIVLAASAPCFAQLKPPRNPQQASSSGESSSGESSSDDRQSNDGASSEDFKADVLQWVDELDASSLKTRRAAEKALIEAGPAALEFLPESRPGVSIEAAQRLQRVRKTLKEMRTETETRSVSSIRLDDVATLGEALEAISRDSGVEFEHDADESLPVTAVKTPLPFWHAVDLVLDEVNLDVNFYGGDSQTIQLVGRDPNRPSRVDSAAYADVYRMEPTAVTARRSLNQPDLSGLNISIEISWQPRMTPIGLTIPVAQLSGRLDNDAALQPQESSDTIDVATNADIAFSEFYLPMELPAGRPSTIESVSGVIRALLPGKQQSFELPLREPNATKTIDAMTVRVESIRKNGPLTEIRIGVDLQGAGRSLESHRHWIFENEVYVLRKDGSRAEHLGFEVFRQTESGVGVGYLFDLGDAVDDSTAVYVSPTAVVPSEVPFVIQDIALP